MTKSTHPVEHYVNEANWPKGLDEAKAFGVEGITAWAWKDKAPKFIMQINRATSVKRVQQLVIFPLLSGEGLGVIK